MAVRGYSSRWTMALLRELEARWGHLDAIVSKDAVVIESERLDKTALEKLFQHEAMAVRVKGFISSEASQELANAMLQDTEVQNWYVNRGQSELSESEVEAVGLPHNVAVASGSESKYFADACRQMRKWRGNKEELRMGPMDKLRLELDEVWRDGCLLARDSASGEPYVAGLPRIMRPAKRFDPDRWTRGFIHIDELDVMRKDRGLFSANIYLQTPPSGGELEIWPLTFSSRLSMYSNAFTLSACLMNDKHAQAYLREKLPKPLTLRVQPGDLVFICTQRPHAVRGPIVGGVRVSMQGFLQFQSGQPLRLQV